MSSKSATVIFVKLHVCHARMERLTGVATVSKGAGLSEGQFLLLARGFRISQVNILGAGNVRIKTIE